MLFQQNCKILENIQIVPNCFKLTFESPEITTNAKPGQFLLVRSDDKNFPLLRRPLGVHRINGNNVEVLFEVVGNGTKVLSQQKLNSKIDVIGPLGNGFDLTPAKETAVLVAGGMGVAPLIFLAETLRKQNKKVTVYIGAKSKQLVLCESDFKNLGCDVHIATDDGSYGQKGVITDLLKLDIRDSILDISIYACGPKAMLKSLSTITNENNIPCQLSLEAFMCCGLGGCFSCVCQTKHGYQRVCKEGPVFNSSVVNFDSV